MRFGAVMIAAPNPPGGKNWQLVAGSGVASPLPVVPMGVGMGIELIVGVAPPNKSEGKGVKFKAASTNALSGLCGCVGDAVKVCGGVSVGVAEGVSVMVELGVTVAVSLVVVVIVGVKVAGNVIAPDWVAIGVMESMDATKLGSSVGSSARVGNSPIKVAPVLSSPPHPIIKRGITIKVKIKYRLFMRLLYRVLMFLL